MTDDERKEREREWKRKYKRKLRAENPEKLRAQWRSENKRRWAKPDNRTKSRDRLRAWVDKRTADGLCSRCGGRNESAFRMCQQCRDTRNAKRKVTRASDAYRAERQAYQKTDRYKQWAKKYRQRNADKLRERNKRSRMRRTEKRRQEWANWKARNPDYHVKRYHKDIHKSRATVLRQQRRRMGIKGSHTVQQWLWRVEYFGWRCAYCRCELTTATLTKDHVIAVSVGGTDFASNLRPACKKCNPGKGARRTYNPPPPSST